MNTRKKVVKTVYRDSESEDEDFSASASEAEIPDETSEDDSSSGHDSGREFAETSSKTRGSAGFGSGKKRSVPVRRKQFAKRLISRLTQNEVCDNEEPEEPKSTFSVKDLTEHDKLLPTVLNLSESDSSEDEDPTERKPANTSKTGTSSGSALHQQADDEDGLQTQYSHDWSENTKKEKSEEVAKKSFDLLQRHTDFLQEAKATMDQYRSEKGEGTQNMSNVQDLLALGEEEVKSGPKKEDSSASEMEDWEEVKDSKPLPQSGIQLLVDFPDAACKKSKKVDVEMMMRRKINRVKKEYQVYMHKVHVLCWLAHGNYVNKVLNDNEVLAAALTLISSENSYPSGRVDTAYLIQISTWYKKFMKLVQDKNENKFKPNAPPLKTTLLKQIKNKCVTSKKILVYIFVTLLRALGIQCRLVLNFVTIPIRPPGSELCSLATKHKMESHDEQKSSSTKKETQAGKNKTATKKSSTRDKMSKIPQLDGPWDCSSSVECSDTDNEIMNQLDGNDDTDLTKHKRVTRMNKLSLKNKETTAVTSEDERQSPLKRQRVNESSCGKNSKSSEETHLSSVKNTEIKKTILDTKTSLKSKSVLKRSRSKSPMVEEDETDGKRSNVKAKGIGKKATDKRIDTISPRKTVPRRSSRSKSPNVESDRANILEENMSKKRNRRKSPSKITVTKTLTPLNRSETTKTQKPNIVKTNVTEENTDKIHSAKTPSKKTTVSMQRSKSKTPKFEETENIHVKEENIDKTKCAKAATTKYGVTRSRSKTPNVLEKENDSVPVKEKKTIAKSPSVTTGISRTRTSGRKTADKSAKTETQDIPSIYFSEPSTSKSTEITIPKILVNSLDVKESVNKNKLSLSRKRARTSSQTVETAKKVVKENAPSKHTERSRTKSAPVKSSETSKYFDNTDISERKTVKTKGNDADISERKTIKTKGNDANISERKTSNTKGNSAKISERKTVKTKDNDNNRVSHRDLVARTPPKKSKIDVKNDLKELIKGRVKEAKMERSKKIVKGKNEESDDSEYLPEEPQRRASSEKDFKPKSATGHKHLDRRVLSSDEDGVREKGLDVWCEVFVEEEEQWISVDVVKPQVHCPERIYTRATHPVTYIVGWDNGNRLKDLTRRYVPAYNTVTRKQRAESPWWNTAVRPWLGEPTARDKEEDQQLDKIMFDAPLPKSIAEYKNHPLYVLQRHLLKFEVLYPSDAPPLGFVRGEAVYARGCVHTCRSRDTWLKEAKTVKMGEKPYKVVKARPKWDKLSNRMISDIPLEIFGPWQVQDYEPPTAENGEVPRNAYGNVELFKECMLPKGTVHIKLPGLNRVAKKLGIDCAAAMTGFDFHGGWTHPVFDGFVVCEEFKDVLTDAWHKEQEEADRREREKMEARVYGNWKKLIKSLLIRERLQRKYAFEDPNAPKKKPKGPRLLVKK